MARDPKNYYQETWKQIRNKVKKFKNIPEQYGKYLESQKDKGSLEITLESQKNNDSSEITS